MATTTSAARLQRQHRRTLRQLRLANDELNHFVRALSHDMRVNFLLLESSFSQLKDNIAKGRQGVPPESVAHVEACLRQSQRFLDDLVELGRSGNVQVEPSTVDLARVVDEVLFEQRELIGQRGVEVQVQRPLPVVWCHEGRLKQILVNLLRNAVKHGCDRQSPKIVIGPAEPPMRKDHPAGSADRTVAFQIHDNGRGIDPRFQEDIFLPGRRLPEADAEGSGMGLAIVRKIVDHYRGSVYVDPDCPSGTAFVVALPPPPVKGQTPQRAEQATRHSVADIPPPFTKGRHDPHTGGPHKSTAAGPRYKTQKSGN
jgi:signal transduction histidine kinase